MPTDQERLARAAARPAVLRLWDALAPLKNVVRFLQTGAHPDDEISGLLAALGRRDGVALGYLCSTRGQGGQNAIGTEAGEDLGALRTREMEEAARILGMRVYWIDRLTGESETPIRDFGFSKSAEDTFRLWGRERIVRACVAVIRRFRPDIVCPTFLDVPGQHGHHRAMTRAILEAVPLAADAGYRTADLPPWRVAKLYLPAWSGAGTSYDDAVPPPNATVTYDAGGTDPAMGMTYAQIGQWSRAAHASQGMGRWVEPGPALYPLHRHDEPRAEASIFEGLPRTLADLAPLAGPQAGCVLAEAQAAIERAIGAWPDGAAVAKAAAAARALVRRARAGLPSAAEAAIGHRLAAKEADLAKVLAEAAGLRVSAIPSRDQVGRGGQVSVRVRATVSETLAGPIHVEPVVGAGAVAEPAEAENGSQWEISVAADAPLADPFPPADEDEADLLRFGAACTIAGEPVTVPIALETPVAVVPRMTVALAPDRLVLNTTQPIERLDLRVTATAHEAGEAEIGLALPNGWSLEGAPRRVALAAGETAAMDVRLIPALAGGPVRAAAAAMLDGAPAFTLHRSRHAHVGAVVRPAPAVVDILSVAAALPEGARIAYIGGGNDRVGEWLGRLGLTVETLGEGALGAADLARFTTVVVGIFALRARADLRAALPRLHGWVQEGGHLVTLYHRPWDDWDERTTPLAPLAIGQPSLRWRVTDPAAPVTVLAPDDPLLCRPNRIGAADWQGWVKERGLYFAARWDEAYAPLLAMSDAGEAPLAGALLSGRFGRGRHTHVSLALHTQLDALVPGAFRLLANLVQPA